MKYAVTDADKVLFADGLEMITMAAAGIGLGADEKAQESLLGDMVAGWFSLGAGLFGVPECRLVDAVEAVVRVRVVGSASSGGSDDLTVERLAAGIRDLLDVDFPGSFLEALERMEAPPLTKTQRRELQGVWIRELQKR